MKTNIETTKKADVLFKASVVLFALSLIVCAADNKALLEIIRNSFPF